MATKGRRTRGARQAHSDDHIESDTKYTKIPLELPAGITFKMCRGGIVLPDNQNLEPPGVVGSSNNIANINDPDAVRKSLEFGWGDLTLYFPVSVPRLWFYLPANERIAHEPGAREPWASRDATKRQKLVSQYLATKSLSFPKGVTLLTQPSTAGHQYVAAANNYKGTSAVKSEYIDVGK